MWPKIGGNGNGNMIDLGTNIGGMVRESELMLNCWSVRWLGQ